MRRSLTLMLAGATVASLGLAGAGLAQDAAEVDPAHYKVEFENDRVRVLRITYPPGEKSEMHSHPEGVVVFMTDLDAKFTLPDGTSETRNVEAGTVVWTHGGTHQPENVGSEPLEVIQIEMK